ncbi:hypothetical protein V8C86DRAFT_1215613 [Haematococcus lacustris]
MGPAARSSPIEHRRNICRTTICSQSSTRHDKWSSRLPHSPQLWQRPQPAANHVRNTLACSNTANQSKWGHSQPSARHFQATCSAHNPPGAHQSPGAGAGAASGRCSSRPPSCRLGEVCCRRCRPPGCRSAPSPGPCHSFPRPAQAPGGLVPHQAGLPVLLPASPAAHPASSARSAQPSHCPCPLPVRIRGGRGGRGGRGSGGRTGSRGGRSRSGRNSSRCGRGAAAGPGRWPRGLSALPRAEAPAAPGTQWSQHDSLLA